VRAPRGLFWVALPLAALLQAGLAALHLRAVQAEVRGLVEAEGHQLGRALRGVMGPPLPVDADGGPSPALEARVAELQELGLRAVVFAGPPGRAPVVVGEPVFPVGPDGPRLLLGDGVARMRLGPPPSGGPPDDGPDPGRPPDGDLPHTVRPEGGAPHEALPDGVPPHGDHPEDGGHGGPPPLEVFVDFAPERALALGGQARGLLGLSALVGLGAVGLAVVGARASAAQARGEAALAESRQLAALGQVAGVMAHELRNPLAALKGHAQLLVELAQGRDRERAGRVVAEAQRLEAITEDLLGFARMAGLSRAPVDPRALAAAAAAASPAPERVEVLPEAGLRATYALDAGRARQLLDNLLHNALTIDTSGAPVQLRLADRGGTLELRVEDAGPGLPPGDPERLFEPFFTTRARGTGLGLAVARRCAQLHGGTLTAGRAPGGGAAFCATLPPEA